MVRRIVKIPSETLLSLRSRLSSLPSRSASRKEEVQKIAVIFNVSTSSVYRSLKSLTQPKGLRRNDRGHPRSIPEQEMLQYCEIIAALKIRTTNKQGRHLSTSRALEILEEHGVETPDGFVQPPKGKLNRVTIDRWLRTWGYDQPHLIRAPAAVRFEAKHSNACWQFGPTGPKIRFRPNFSTNQERIISFIIYNSLRNASFVKSWKYNTLKIQHVTLP